MWFGPPFSPFPVRSVGFGQSLRLPRPPIHGQIPPAFPMPKASNPAFTFICGADDFLVGRLGQERFTAMATEAGADDFSREIINGFAGNVDEVEAAVNRFRVSVLVTAAPVDRRRSFPKWCEANGDFTLIGGGEGDGAEALAGVALAEARAAGVTFGDGAIEILLSKVGANTRLLTEEIRKLSTYVDAGGVIEEAQVIELTPNMAEGDFFEAADRFFASDLKGTLGALQRHFFTGGDARPVLSSLQNRNRILIQARVLIDAGDLRT